MQGRRAGRHSLVRQIVRWVPAALLILVLTSCWAAAFRGGLAGVVAWHALQLIAPILGLALLPVSIAYAVWKRRLSFPSLTATLLALVAIWPLCWNVNLLAVKYPVSVGRAQPSVAVRLPADAPLRVAWGGDSLATNHLAAYPDRRWAYDLTVDPSFVGAIDSKITAAGACRSWRRRWAASCGPATGSRTRRRGKLEQLRRAGR